MLNPALSLVGTAGSAVSVIIATRSPVMGLAALAMTIAVVLVLT